MQANGVIAQRLATQLESIIEVRLEAENFLLPSLPVFVERALVLLRDPSVSLKRVATLFERDPLATARLLRLANSAAYASAGTTHSLTEALTRIGTQRLRTFLYEISARKLFESRDRRIEVATRNVWQHSVAVAVLARDLVAFSADTEGMERAYLCGLLHDVGKPVLAGFLLEAEKEIYVQRGRSWIDARVWNDVISIGHRTVGVAVAERWGMPEEVVRAIRECDDYDPVDRTSAPNFVRFANALAKREGLGAGPFDAGDVDTMIMIGRSVLGVDDELVARVTKGLAEKVASNG